MSNPYNSQNPAGSVAYNALRDRPDFGPHFRLEEFRSKDGTLAVLVHPALIALLRRIREHFGAPVTINSGFRTEAHNADIGGASASKHLLGQAADIVVRGKSPDVVADYAEALGAGGVFRYKTFVHVDVFGKNRRGDFR